MTDVQCAATVLVARHGEATYEPGARTDAGGSLTPLGRRQAADLADMVRHRRVGSIWTSSMARAVQTAEIVAAKIGCPDVHVREALREFSVGPVARDAVVGAAFDDVFQAWDRDELDAGFDGGETGSQVVSRIREVLAEIADLHRGECVLVITHGGVMSFVLPRVARNLPRRPAAIALENASIVDFAADADGWVCRSWAGQTIEPALG